MLPPPATQHKNTGPTNYDATTDPIDAATDPVVFIGCATTPMTARAEAAKSLPHIDISWPDNGAHFEETINPLNTSTVKGLNHPASHPASRAAPGTLEVSKQTTKVYTTRQTKLSPCKTCLTLFCQREIILLLVVVLFLAVAHLFIYVSYISMLEYELAWVFFLLSTASWILGLSFIFRPIMTACCNVSEKKLLRTYSGRLIVGKQKTASSRCPAIQDWSSSFTELYRETFNINGKYFLTKMYTAASISNLFQVIDMTTVYLCWFPLSLTAVISSIVVFEICANMYIAWNLSSQLIRDRSLLMGITTDVFFLAFPAMYMRFSFFLPLRPTTMLQITLIPTLSILSLSHDLWEDVFKVDVHRTSSLGLEQNRGKRHRRGSFLKMSENSKVHKLQLKHFSTAQRKGFSILNFCFALFFVILVLVQLIMQPSKEECSDFYTGEIWKGCDVPTPFCQNSFVPRCDCAIIQLTNYSQKQLPDSFGNMTSLLKLAAFNGQLETLPDDLGKNHPAMKVLQVVGHQLEKLPDSVGDLHDLINLWVYNNRLTSLPKSINKLVKMSRLTVYNNFLTEIPAGLTNLLKLYAWNNDLKVLPKGMKELTSVDVRNNALISLPIEEWKHIKYLYAAGNPFCSNHSAEFVADAQKSVERGGLCETQCSKDCPEKWKGDGFCDDSSFGGGGLPTPNAGCNTKDCEYDGGDCL